MTQFSYFPYRTEKNRPYIKDFFELPREERTWDVLVQMVVSSTRRAFGDDLKKDPRTHTCVMNESWLATALSSFFRGGQVVFHVSDVLKNAFKTSDLGDVTVSDLRFPFDHSYVHIGRDAGLTFNNGAAYLEGVLLDNEKSSLSMTLVGELVEEPAHWGERGMESFTFFLQGK